MANTKLVREGFTIPMPKPGDGTKIMCRPDGSLYCSWDRPPARMALDAALPAAKSGGYCGSGDDDPNDIYLDTPNSGGDDLRDQIHQLLAGKLDDGDIDMLIKLIEGPDDTDTAPAAAQDRRGRRQARDAMPSRAEILRRIAKSGEVRAERAQKQNAALVARFPALKNARVV